MIAMDIKLIMATADNRMEIVAVSMEVSISMIFLVIFLIYLAKETLEAEKRALLNEALTSDIILLFLLKKLLMAPTPKYLSIFLVNAMFATEVGQKIMKKLAVAQLATVMEKFALNKVSLLLKEHAPLVMGLDKSLKILAKIAMAKAG